MDSLVQAPIDADLMVPAWECLDEGACPGAEAVMLQRSARSRAPRLMAPTTTTDSAQQVLDLTAPAWECLDEGAWAAGAKPCRGGCAWSAFSGGRLLTLRPDQDDCLTELQACTLPCGQGEE